MNLYRINYEANSEAHYMMITELTESRAIQSFKKVCGPQPIISVDLIQENASATKEQEQKAVEKIRAILSTLGPDSYTATALEGCLEVAESNIENDFADSWKGRCECAEREVESLRSKLTESQSQLQSLQDEITRLQARIDTLQAQVLSDDDLTDIRQLLDDREVDEEEVAQKAADEIVRLADNPDSRDFRDAVATHRTFTAKAEYTRNLKFRVEAIENARHAGDR